MVLGCSPVFHGICQEVLLAVMLSKSQLRFFTFICPSLIGFAFVFWVLA